MKKVALIVLLLAFPVLASAAGGGNIHLDKANINLDNKQSLRNGARLFMNYCLSCHSAGYQRYSRMGEDLGLSEEQVIENLMLAGDKIGQLMTISMAPSDAAQWFGAPPPDLTLSARLRGVDWLYTYLREFYIDESRPFGVNNRVFPSVGMPHVLWELQGMQKAVVETSVDDNGGEHHVITGFEMVSPGSMSADEYDKAIRDLVNFMAYMGEPVQQQRKTMGVWVILFLLVLLVPAYLLKKEYWKDVH